MAADSAVTIGNHLAVHNSTNKLFQLSYAPVGLITYGNAILMGVPIEIIINEYSKHLGDKTFPWLRDYAEDFCKFLGENSSYLTFDSFSERFVHNMCANLIGWIRNEYDSYILKSRINPNDMDRAAKQSAYDMAFNNIISQINKRVKTDDYFAKYTREKHFKYLEAAIKKDIGLNYMSDEQKKLLCDMTFEMLGRNVTWDKDKVGIVISGYGEQDIYPRLCHFQMDRVIGGKVGINYREEDTEISEAHPSYINTFAQRDIMENILYGMDRDETNRLMDIPNQIRQFINKDKLFLECFAAQKDSVISRICDSIRTRINLIIDSKRWQNDIRNSIVYLPVQELALLAESMINITSIISKVKADENNSTVGGPVDVAVISKNDGFVWIKRKKYFSNIDNPQYSTYVNHFENNQKGTTFSDVIGWMHGKGK